MKISVLKGILPVAAALALSSPLWAHQEVVGKLKIGHPWVRAAAEGAPGTYACVIEIANEGDEPERLIGATIEGAGAGTLYQLTERDGHFTSKPVDGVAIKPHGSIELTPTTYQFKFGKITKSLTEDSMVPGTLIFEKQHSAPVHFMVEADDTAPKEDAEADSGADHDHMNRGK
jgi:copper(I)-binding protein